MTHKCNCCGKIHTEIPKNARPYHDTDTNSDILGYFWECVCMSTMFHLVRSLDTSNPDTSTWKQVFVCPFCGKQIAEENNIGCCGEVGHGEWIYRDEDGNEREYKNVL